MKGLSLFLKLVFALNVISAFILLLACIAPYVTWELFSFLSFLSLIVPYLVLGNLVFLIFWLFKWKRQFLISFFTLVLGFFTQGIFLKFSISNDEIKKEDISLLTFNSHGSMGLRWSRRPNFSNEIIDFIKEQDADIVCLQEFEDFRTGSRALKIQYPHFYVNREIDYKNTFRVIQAIFSKYPIVGTGSLSFPETNNNAIYSDIKIKKDTIRVYNLHLQSLSFRPGMLKREEPQRLFKRLDKSIQKQQEQAKLVLEHSRKVNYIKIISGDFNNTQFSSVYNTIKEELNDTFLEKGFGLGSTYNLKFLPFRIDFILTDPEMEIKSHKNFDVRLSDHEPVMAS
ncbi:MAG: endonuclease/exonuclease/phosphatase family protein, partial [Maribacter sp.]|nr:endonuclease/exonuclease/phosphatase family protein [Maribacter sp.]